ncbi:alpha/beta fold hydrolase [Nocardioides sp. NPDC006273]|uniref:alpha/beta fold hydrolase n=1 Tax=Nocardioides sp. NPDC006273 TaxID=3155598 RepID=UPI00339E0D2A
MSVIELTETSDDAWIPVDRAHRLADLIPGAELTVIPDAGHLVHLDQPAALAATLTEWLLRQSRG